MHKPSVMREEGAVSWSVRTSRDGLRFLMVNPTIVDKREHLHIGVATVSSYVAKKSKHRVRILDFMAHRLTWRERLRAVLAEYRPDVVAMYVSTPYFPVARRVAEEIRRIAPGVPIVAGGHHATLAPEDTMTVAAFDMLIVGEGEKPMVSLLDTLAEGAPLSNVPGLWWREAGELRKTDKTSLIEADEIPTIDWSLHDEETLRTNFFYWGVLPVMASRGCPARCSFCSITNLQKMYSGERFLRFRDPVQVVDEIAADFERYGPLGMRMIYFYDLNFLVNPKWLRKFTDEYKRRGLAEKLKWSAYTRADHVVPSTIESLRNSGCVNLRVGIEAANPYMRNVLYEKDVTQEEVIEAIRQIKALGISITGYFMAGGPGERPEWLLESMDLSKRHGVDFPVFFLYKPLAGTDILDRAEELGSKLLDNAAAGADFLHGVNMEHAHIKAWQLQLFLLATHAAFGPALVVSQLRRVGALAYARRMAEYLPRAVRTGFTPYGALTYFVFYGYDHLEEPFIVPPVEKAGLAFRALRALVGAALGHSGQPEPKIEPKKPRKTVSTMVDDDELRVTSLVPLRGLSRRAAGQTT
jgi:anaerobic magnesium-protoporphyrin IX monomethyl ester cyclase